MFNNLSYTVGRVSMATDDFRLNYYPYGIIGSTLCSQKKRFENFFVVHHKLDGIVR